MTRFVQGPGLLTPGGITNLTFVGAANIHQTLNNTVTTIPMSEISGGVKKGDICVFCAFTDNGTSALSTHSINSGANGTPIVNNFDGTEYPEGVSFYYVATRDFTSNPSITFTGSDTSVGTLLVFRPVGSISNVVVGGTDTGDGATALSLAVSASPSVVPDKTVRLWIAFATGRPLSTSVQNVDINHDTDPGWTQFDGGTTNMDYSYKWDLAGVTSQTTEDFTTNDAGRQGAHLFYLELT